VDLKESYAPFATHVPWGRNLVNGKVYYYEKKSTKDHNTLYEGDFKVKSRQQVSRVYDEVQEHPELGGRASRITDACYSLLEVVVNIGLICRPLSTSPQVCIYLELEVSSFPTRDAIIAALCPALAPFPRRRGAG
jgi:hypothetical protein